MTKRLAIGWDVGGWRGKNQAVAILQEEAGEWRWVGEPTAFRLPISTSPADSLVDFIRVAWPGVPDDILETHQVTIGIDAPLGFPLAFQRIVSREVTGALPDGPQIENPLAYRETERWIHQHHHRTPLSAPFDKLGNNATVAIAYTARWSQQHGLVTVPFHSPADDAHVALEVYPALVKKRGENECRPEFEHFMPDGIERGSHASDAAICAVFASLWSAPRIDASGRPMTLVGPPASIPASIIEAEGWIYAPEPDGLHDPATGRSG